MTNPRYPYTHKGPSVHGSKVLDYLISEQSLREDRPELFGDMHQMDEPEPERAPEPAPAAYVLILAGVLFGIGAAAVVVVW